ncbi:unnamed protein product [Vicia faba]|uniref:Uncharacterized protein n=1 Tax=Vicia faba TaxID=3906 RepID=A0AAV0YQ75_VICFA|nr:unnamed protein product [Vicia faba]
MKRGIRVTSRGSSSLSHDPLCSLLNSGRSTPSSQPMNANATATLHLCFNHKPSPLNMVQSLISIHEGDLSPLAIVSISNTSSFFRHHTLQIYSHVLLSITDSRVQNKICKRISKENSPIRDVPVIIQSDGEQEDQRNYVGEAVKGLFCYAGPASVTGWDLVAGRNLSTFRPSSFLPLKPRYADKDWYEAADAQFGESMELWP